MNGLDAPSPIIHTLYGALHRNAGAFPPGEGIRPLRRALVERFASLNHIATVYVLGDGEGEQDARLFEGVLGDVSAFLVENGFLQVSLRPVHRFPARAAEVEALRRLYETFLDTCKPFQEEAYREQIVARFRVFPLFFVEDVVALDRAWDVLASLKARFFLPSLLLPLGERHRLPPLLAGASEAPFERILFVEGNRYEPEELLQSLHANAQMDRLLDATRATMDARAMCDGMLVVGPDRRARSCVRQDVRLAAVGEAERDGAADGGADPEPPVCQHASEPPCGDCIRAMLQRVEWSFRAAGREASWRELCEKTAFVLQKTGDPAGALEAWDRSSDGLPEDAIAPDVRVHRGLCLYEKGGLEAAMAELSHARSALPEAPEVRYYMGLCEFGWRDYIEAADRFREALDLGLAGALREDAEYFRGESHYHLQEYDEAREALRLARRSGRDDSPVHFYEGLCLLEQGDPEASLACLERALERGPRPNDLFHVLFYLAYAHKERGAFEDALGFCARAEAEQPASYELHNLRGFCHFKRGEYDEAIGSFRKALEIDPGSGIDYANIGSNLREKGDLEGAVGMYRRALALDPSLDFARENLARLEARLGKRKP